MCKYINILYIYICIYIYGGDGGRTSREQV